MKRFGEIIFAVSFVGLLVGPVYLFDVPPMWGYMWWSVVAVVVLWELISLWRMKKKTGKARTISQQFWKWSLENRTRAWITIGCWVAAVLVLAYHLASKMLK